MTAQPPGKQEMMTRQDRHYYLGRAEAEIDLAQRATHPDVVGVHYQMAERYLDRVYGSPESDPS